MILFNSIKINLIPQNSYTMKSGEENSIKPEDSQEGIHTKEPKIPRYQAHCQICKNTNITLISLSANNHDPLLSFITVKQTSQHFPKLIYESGTNCLSTQDGEAGGTKFLERRTEADLKLKSGENRFMCEDCISRLYHEIKCLTMKRETEREEHVPIYGSEEIKEKQIMKQDIKNPNIPGTLSLLLERSPKNDLTEERPREKQAIQQDKKLLSPKKMDCSILGLMSNSSGQIYREKQMKGSEKESGKKEKARLELGLVSNYGSEQGLEAVDIQMIDFKESEMLENYRGTNSEEELKQNMYNNLLYKALILDRKEAPSPDIDIFPIQRPQQIPTILKSFDNKLPNNLQKQAFNYPKKHINLLGPRLQQLKHGREQEQKNLNRSECSFCHIVKLAIIDEQSIICLDCYMGKHIEGREFSSGKYGTIEV